MADSHRSVDGMPVASATECTGLIPALPPAENDAARAAALHNARRTRRTAERAADPESIRKDG